VNLRCLLFLALAGSCGVATPAFATETLRLDAAVARAMASNPTLAAEAAVLRGTQARAGREGLPTPYTAGVAVENVAGTGALNGTRLAETTLRVGRVIELGGKREARQAFGAAGVSRQRNAAAAVRIEVVTRTTARFIEVLADQQRLDYAGERVQQAERTRREVASWVAAARNPESDLKAAEIAVAEAGLAREHAEHELAAARLTLAASWGATSPDFESVAGELGELPPVDSFDALAARLPQSPAQRAGLLEAEEAKAQRRVATASGTPDIDLSLGVRRLAAFNDYGLVFSATVPLGTRSRSRYAVAEANAQVEAAESRGAARRVETHQSLFETYQELTHARVEYASLQDTMLPKANEALAFVRRSFKAGQSSFLALAQAQTTVFDLRLRSIEAATRYHLLLIEVDRLTAPATETLP
jgi:cobalt-zinc-cadmium efflux system outer membrane protein